MTALGFKLYLRPEIQGCIITTFCTPPDKNYHFDRIVGVFIYWVEFYQFLAKRNLFIYPGKTTKADTFRIGSIGALDADDMHILVEAITEALHTMGVTLPIKY